jgi:lipopolysaccharide biosynthesis glycosyltransferase
LSPRKRWNGQEALKPAFAKNNILIVLAADNNYAAYTSVAIQSIIDSSSKNNNYDIIVLTENISARNMDLIKSQAQKYNNISIRFYYMQDMIGDEYRKYIVPRGHIGGASLYRLFAASVLVNYDKTICLDSDLITLEDIANLYHMDIENYAAIATLDPKITYDILKDKPEPKYKKFLEETLKIEDPSKLFNASVMVFNLKKWRAEGYEEKFLASLSTHTMHCPDQEILNAFLQKAIKIISHEWNYTSSVNDWGTYFDSKNKRVIHYAARNKPWNTSGLEYGEIWWDYARKSPFYEEILYKNLAHIHHTHNNSSAATPTNASLSPMQNDRELRWLLHETFCYPSHLKRYKKYKLRAIFSVGKTKQKYIQKRDEMKARIDWIKKQKFGL